MVSLKNENWKSVCSSWANFDHQCWLLRRDVLRTEENQKIGEKTKNQATLYGSSKVPEDADTTLGDTQGSKSWHDIQLFSV